MTRLIDETRPSDQLMQTGEELIVGMAQLHELEVQELQVPIDLRHALIGEVEVVHLSYPGKYKRLQRVGVKRWIHPHSLEPISCFCLLARMDDIETATQLLAQMTRTLRLLNFRFMQLRHTNDQLLAGLHDLIALASLIDQASQAHGDASPPLLRKAPPS